MFCLQMFTIPILAMLLRWVIQSLDSITEWKMSTQVFWMEAAGVTLLFGYKHEINGQTHHRDQLRWGMPPCWRQGVCTGLAGRRAQLCWILTCSESSAALVMETYHSQLCAVCLLLPSTESSVSPAPLCASTFFNIALQVLLLVNTRIAVLGVWIYLYEEKDIYDIISILSPAFN